MDTENLHRGYFQGIKRDEKIKLKLLTLQSEETALNFLKEY